MSGNGRPRYTLCRYVSSILSPAVQKKHRKEQKNRGAPLRQQVCAPRHHLIMRRALQTSVQDTGCRQCPHHSPYYHFCPDGLDAPARQQTGEEACGFLRCLCVHSRTHKRGYSSSPRRCRQAPCTLHAMLPPAERTRKKKSLNLTSSLKSSSCYGTLPLS